MTISYDEARAITVHRCRKCARPEGEVKFSGANLVCNPCRGRDYYARNRDKCIVAARKHYNENKEKIRAREREKHRRNPDLKRDTQLRGNYGITLADYRAMHASQNGGCLICDRKMETLSVDHCHATGLVRGLLCPECNSGIGYFRDDTKLMLRAIDYLAASRLRECA